jgi:hypothetical protein
MSLLDPNTFFGIDKDTYLDEVKGEYLKNNNKEIVVYIILLIYNKSIKTQELVVQKKMDDRFENFAIPISNIDLGDIETLSLLLKQVPELFDQSVENRVFVGWGHAMGYSLFFKIQPGDQFKNFSFLNNKTFQDLFENTNEKLKVTKAIFPILQESNIEKMEFGNASSSFDSTSKVSALTINELSKAIQRTGVKFDLMIFDNCFLQNVDTLYTLKDLSNYIVAPQTGFAWRGYDYSSLNKLNAKVGDQFCTTFCEDSFLELQKKPSNEYSNDFTWEKIAFSWIRTSDANELFLNIGRIIYFFRKYFRNKRSGIPAAIYNAITNCSDLSQSAYAPHVGLWLIDLKRFLTLYDENIEMRYDEFEPYYKRTMELIQKMIKIYPGSETKTDANGLSIFFPPDKKSCRDSEYYSFFINTGAQIQSAFSKEMYWGAFINEFLK